MTTAVRCRILALSLLIWTVVPSEARAAPEATDRTCHFVLGFATLVGMLPGTVGSCLEDQSFAVNGDATQRTTGGLLVWRKADNWTAFTDGSRTWINGPAGLASRLNTERFPWEANLDSFPVIGQTPASAPFWRQDTISAFRAWSLNGISIGGAEAAPAIRLAPGGQTLACTATAIDGGAATFDPQSGLCAGVDPKAPGSYDDGQNYYSGAAFYFGTMTSPVVAPQGGFDQLVASWDASTPSGTWLEFHVRALEPAGWTGWYALPIWASDAGTIQPHSVAGQRDATGRVAVDTFLTQPAGRSATAYQLGVTLFTTAPSRSPVLRLVAASVVSTTVPVPPVAADPSVWGTNLPVPQRSQMLAPYQGLAFGGGGEAWCSPTSTSMVMAYWAQVRGRPDLVRSVPDVAAHTYDVTYAGTGDWPFNTAYAADAGLVGYVTHLNSLSQVEQWIKAGVPIIISVAFQRGQLPGEPVQQSAGHLLVVRGFTAGGDVITNDPAAATDAGVQIVYNRADLQRVWLDSSHGAAYVIYPQGWPIPTTKILGSW